jgi:hypothetical protein
MKLNLSNRTHIQGTALIVTLTVVTVAAIMLGSYLTLVQGQTASVARSQTWNAIIPVTEAGVEDGMAMINSSETADSLDPTGMAWTNGVGTGSDGWSTMNAGITTATRDLGTNGHRYTTTIDINQVGPGGGPLVTATGVIPYSSIPWVFCKNGSRLNRNPSQPFFFAAAGAPSFSGATPSTVGRKVQINTKLLPLFAIGIACRSNFYMNGNNCRVDSFDSTDPNYSVYFTNAFTGTNGINIYSLARCKAGGDVGVNSAVVGAVNVGNGNIYGHLSTGPGSLVSQVQIGPNGTVGDLTWGGSGIENVGTPTSWWSPDFNVTFPSLKSPKFSGTYLPAAQTNGPLNTYIVIPQGGAITNYIVSTDPGKTIYVAGKTTLWVKGSLQVNVIIAPTNNASLDLYVGTTNGTGDSISLAGSSSSTLNQPGYAKNLRIFGLPSLSSIDMHGNAGWTASVYAPDADVLGGGGGNSTQDTQGAIVCRSMTLKGKWNFHFDESLRSSGAVRGWVAKNWKELPYNP